MDNQKQIKILEEKILRHKNLYYQGKPEISDFEYDKIEDELRVLDPKSYVLNIVGTTIFSGEKIEHDKKMLSLNKTYKIDELIKWQDSKEIISTFKIDGSSCSIIYKNGKFNLAKTRGDGRFGENISSKILLIDHIPKTISMNEDIEIRGEVYCTEENFLKLTEVMQNMGLEKPTSQRNIVAGLLGRKENIELCKYLSFQAFEFISEDISLKTEQDKFKTLIQLGFLTPEYNLNRTKEDLELRLNETRDFMSSGNYLIDGLVFSYNDQELHRTLGETAHHPRYKIAFKFQGETKETVIKSISWQVSRNGILTPVGNVEPVELSGAKVSRVTLHNFGLVKQNKLKVGDRIEIVRSGEVIPKFLSVVTESDNAFLFPEKCPSCERETRIDDIRLLCDNRECPDKIKDEILNFIQKIGIEDLSSKRLEEFIRLGLIKNIPSLYELKVEDLLSVDKVKDKLASKIIASIDKSKSANLITFLSALGISGGAYNKCEKIVTNGYDSIEKIMRMKYSDLELIESFAEKSATDFVNSLQSKAEIINKLIGYGFELKHNVATTNAESSIAGMKFCITGTLTVKRSELQKMIKENGGIVQSGVSKETNFLVTNDTESTSSKFKKAKQLEVPIITDTKLFEMINS